MEIKKTNNDKKYTFALSGSLDTTTAPELQKEFDDIKDSVESLVIDLKNLDYISSAGLRVLLAIAKATKLEVINVNDTVSEIFRMTGFDKVLNLK